MLGVTPTRIQALIKKGKLTTRRDARGKEQIERKSLEERLAAFRNEKHDSNISLNMLLNAVRTFHHLNHFVVGTGNRNDLLLRLALLIQEIGELSETVTKSSKGANHGFTDADWTAMQNEWGDVLYLMIGWAVEMGWDADTIAEIFQRTHQKNLSRAPRHTALARTSPEPPTTE
ncbi:MazG nucleotide pyrophosphohydrolase domain-containing protein [Sulfobacillus thermosulfidooxidans DSM 9293]|uniref:MazG nucleotide pyrophosphohydrolase domain-containing protein n=2 Tax=Sulfobacillus thermosulfidooxidans TaxID=28034 RepID=A0A1W1WP60_SULTA|nr:MazG nucleotide pyrophosphohydrolase domain-containing protein [Sulfobacillus thermosulfidooxidans DSM 9293]